MTTIKTLNRSRLFFNPLSNCFRLDMYQIAMKVNFIYLHDD